MRIRLATQDDADLIAQLHTASWRRTYRGMLSDRYLDEEAPAERAALWEQRLRAPTDAQRVLVAEEEGALAGFACAYGASDARWGTLLDNLHVASAHQGLGLGTALLAEVVAWSAARYAGDGLFLWVLEQNERARRFYERFGATRADEELWRPPGGGEVVVLRYVWPAPVTLSPYPWS